MQSYAEESANQTDKAQNRTVPGDLKLADLDFPSFGDPGVDFRLEGCKLVQANAILTELIKEAVLEKYGLSEKIHLVLEQIKKLQSKQNTK